MKNNKLLVLSSLMIMSLGMSAQSLDDLAVTVNAKANREYSFTDKKSGYWYGRTHQDKPVDWFAGWNVAKKRVLSDYTLYIDGKQMKRSDASEVVVSPENVTRRWKGVTERLQLLDGTMLVLVNVDAPKSKKLSVVLTYPEDADKSMIKVFGLDGSPAKKSGERYVVSSKSGGFLLAYGTDTEVKEYVAKFCHDSASAIGERHNRMQRIISHNNPIKSNLPDLDLSLQWLTLTMDELITEQQGKGIYAGLPWFNEYWGRDMFIAMPGATLVSGQFDCSKDILRDFSKFQDRDPNSQTCGRIPNRANLEGILYNTADGTPRFVIEVEELLNYCGDASFLKDIYPSIVLSTDQSLLHHTDTDGYLMHEDADTWMDVKRNGIPGSPRGNRANDIQYLWYKQLTSAAHLATLMNDTAHASQWTEAAQRIARNFERDFCDKNSMMIYDHLNIDGTPDKQFRPNQLFCFDLIADDEFKQKVTRRCWEELVYPWGVSSLSQTDPQFHPQHENWHYYHKDDAYHNGTIWQWNNGIAMQRMIEYGQKEMAWQLFKNMNRQAMLQGAVGSLSENADAHPRADRSPESYGGKEWVNLSGTFLQAWSNSEHLRVWYQHFLGIQPDMMNRTVNVTPHLPNEITDLETSMIIGDGKIHYSYHNGSFSFRLENLPDITLNVTLENADAIRQSAENPIFKNLDFCRPRPLSHYPCFDHYYEEPLTY